MTLATGAGPAGGSPAITAILAGKTQKEEEFESRNPYGSLGVGCLSVQSMEFYGLL